VTEGYTYSEIGHAYDGQGLDAVVLTFTNNTDVAITSVKVYFICTDINGKTVRPGNFPGKVVVSEDLSYSENLMEANWASLNVKPGTNLVAKFRCNFSRFENMNIIVYSYTDANGKEVINENAYNWLPLTLEK
jgi:hypothetical protein